MIESKPELELERDSFLMSRWVVKRISAERTLNTIGHDVDTPVTMLADLNWEIDLLDRFLAIGIQRSRRWGVEEEALSATRILTSVLANERNRTEDG